MLTYELNEGLPTEPVLTAVVNLHQKVFASQTADELIQELTYQARRGPLLTLLAFNGPQVVGYKIGYERKPGHFYSWLGCVDPACRRQGIAAELMQRQHDWCLQRGYHTVRTQTYNQWRNMLILNLRVGYDIVGTQQGAHGLIIVLEKRL